MSALGIASQGLLSRGSKPTQSIAAQGFLASDAVEARRGGSGNGWRGYKALQETPDNRPGGPVFYSPQYYAKAEQLGEAEQTEQKLADQVASTSKKLVYLASERAGAKSQRDKLKTQLNAEKRALAASMAIVEQLAADITRMKREEDDALALLLLLD